MACTIKTDINTLWALYSGGAASGRFSCPIRIVASGQTIEATHIYRGYGATRLERISGVVAKGKGFQGEDVTPIGKTFQIED